MTTYVPRSLRHGEEKASVFRYVGGSVGWSLCFFVPVSILFLTLSPKVLAAANLASTPPMGWASWNYYFCDYTEQTIREQADALVSTGLRDLGYRYVIIQECIAPARDDHGRIVPDLNRFPHGITALVDYIHARGLKAGIYTDVGPFTCFSKTRYQGSYNHEDQDARTFSDWGIDLIEVDFCNKPVEHSGKELYTRMADAIRKTGRPMLFYVCSWGEENPWEWAPGMAQLWRTTGDISYEPGRVKWESVVRNFELNAQHSGFTAPNSWNDPDMLEVGNQGLTAEEARSHFSMWAISAAPLWLGTDLTHIDPGAQAILTNPEIIAIDQDSLGAGVHRIGEQAGVEVWAKPLERWSGAVQAVFLLNRTASKAMLRLKWQDLGLLPRVAVRDLWAHNDLGTFENGYTTELRAHASLLLKVIGKASPARPIVYEAEWPGNLKPHSAKLLQCQGCSGGYGLSLSASSDMDTNEIIFPQVDVEEDGLYLLSLHSPRGSGSGRVTVSVDQGAPISFRSFQHSAKEDTMLAKTKLHSGRNVLGIRSATPFVLDCLMISADQ